MGVLRGNQGVEVLTGRENFSRGFRSIELRGVTLDGGELALELCADVHHERRFDGVFSVRKRIQNLVRPVCRSAGIIASEPRQVTRVPAELRCDAMIWMPPDGEGKNHNPRSKMSYVLH